MSNNNYPRPLLDDAIDRAVQGLVQGDARPGFRRRVLSKLHAPARASWASRLLVPVGAMAALLVVISTAMWLIPERTVPTATPPAAATVAQHEIPPAVPAIEPPKPVAEDAPVKPAGKPRERGRRQPPAQFTFGPPSNRVTATSVDSQQATPTAPKTTGVTQEQKPPAQSVNIKLELIITEQREGGTATPKTVTMLIADRDRGQLKSGGSGDQMLNVDALPEILRDSRVRVHLMFDYRLPRTESDRVPPTIRQTISSIVEDGKPMVITQWTEPGSTRTVRVELKAAIQK